LAAGSFANLIISGKETRKKDLIGKDEWVGTLSGGVVSYNIGGEVKKNKSWDKKEGKSFESSKKQTIDVN